MNDYNKILKYIQKEIVPEYPEIESCTMHNLPKEFNSKDVEFIFKIKFNLNKDDRDNLKRNILMRIQSTFGRDSTHKLLIILTEF